LPAGTNALPFRYKFSVGNDLQKGSKEEDYLYGAAKKK
jgi:hypothetical protein